MRPYLEVVERRVDASWVMLNRRLEDGIPFQWHHHPEYELTLTLNSVGQRFIGDHAGEYEDGDLVLVGPNQPHTWVSRAKLAEDQPHVALVLWFHPQWIGRLLEGAVELSGVASMLARGRAGLKFSPETACGVRRDFEELFERPPARRLLSLLGILNRIADDKDAITLATPVARHKPLTESRDRIDRILLHLHQNYTRQISLDELADKAALSVSGLHRLFRRHTGTTVSDYLMRLRIGDACARLSSTDRPVQQIAEAVGYNTIANFNRQFKAVRGMKPSDYRKLFR